MFNAIRRWGMGQAGKVGAITNPGFLQKARGWGALQLGTMGNAGMTGIAGGVVGGAYGAFSDNTSVLGGALGGAALGAGGYGLSRLGRTGFSTYSAMRKAREGAGQAAHAGLAAMGRESAGYFGSQYTRAVNGWKTLRAGLSDGWKGR